MSLKNVFMTMIFLMLLGFVIWYKHLAKPIVRQLELMENASNWTGSPYLTPKYLIEPLKVEYMSAKFVIYVYSSFSNIEKRNQYRKAFTDLFQKSETKWIFVIGKPTERHKDIDKVKHELKTHNDLLKIDVPDTYWNLGYKGIFALTWIVKKKSTTNSQKQL